MHQFSNPNQTIDLLSSDEEEFTTTDMNNVTKTVNDDISGCEDIVTTTEVNNDLPDIIKDAVYLEFYKGAISD